MFVLDSHCDTPSQILRLRDMGTDNAIGHVDFPKMKRGGIDASFFALYVPAEMDTDAARAYADRLLSMTLRSIESNKECAALAKSVQEARENKAKGLISIFLGLENASPLGDTPEFLRYYHDCGVRYVTLCHCADNLVCDSCAGQGRWGGLSPLGREVVAEMNRLGMLVDVSHISDKSFYDVLECSSRPVAATHSCCRALSDHPRNMTDDMIRALSEQGGVIQINFYPLFLDAHYADSKNHAEKLNEAELMEAAFIRNPSDSFARDRWFSAFKGLLDLPRPSYKKIADHIDHAVEIAGIDHVGIGSDFDGISITPEGMDNISMLPVLFEELKNRGYSDFDLEKLAGENFLRVLSLAKI